MIIKNKIAVHALLISAFCLAASSCQKMERPALGDYARDTNPPGGPLKFYAAFDERSVDSIRANFGVNNNVDFVEGVSGDAVSGGSNGYVVFPSANDFNTATDFTVAFWLKKNGPNPAGTGTSFAFGLASTSGVWTQQEMFLLFEDAGNPSSADSAAAKFYVNDQWFEFITNTNAGKYTRLPKVLNGEWHHLAFAFDQETSTLTTYLDGQEYTNLPAGFNKFTNNGGKVNFSKIGGLVVGGPGHYALGKTPDAWMGNFNGQIDQFRMYATTLSASEVADLYAKKL